MNNTSFMNIWGNNFNMTVVSVIAVLKNIPSQVSIKYFHKSVQTVTE